MSKKRALGGGAAALAALFLFLHGFFFVFHPTRGVAYGLSYLLPCPVAIASGIPVSYRSVAALTNGLLEESLFSSHEDAFQAALTRSVENARVLALARELHVDVQTAESGAEGDSDFHKTYVSAPLLLAQKTEDAVLQDAALQDLPKIRLENLRARFVDGTLPFADAAPRFSEDVSGGNAGDLGVFLLTEVPAWLVPAAQLEKGAVSEVLEGPDAYWLIEVSDRGGESTPPSEGGAGGGESPSGEWVRFRGIAAKKETLKSILDERLSENPPWIFVW
jgi:hypothetical protein